MDMDELDLDYWLRSISERLSVIQLDIDAPSFFAGIWNKQHTSGMVQDSVLPVISREKRGKALVF